MGGKEDETANHQDTENTMKTIRKNIITTVSIWLLRRAYSQRLT